MILLLIYYIEESYERLTNFTNKLREIYRIVKYKMIFMPNHFKLDDLKETLKNYILFKEILILYFDEISIMYLN